MGSADVIVTERKEVELSGRRCPESLASRSSNDGSGRTDVDVEVGVNLGSYSESERVRALAAARVVDVVDRRTWIRSFFNRSSAAAS